MKRPAIDPIGEVEGQTGTIYPEPFRSIVKGRTKRRLGPALNLTDFGVNLVELAPGAASALRHWHHREDEFVYVLEGEITLITDAGPQVLRAGQAAGFPKGVPDGHHLVNRSAAKAVYLEVGSRVVGERVDYPDVDLVYEDGRFTRKDGGAY